MNPIFSKLLREHPVSFKPFLQWYNEKYPNSLAVFQNLPFSHQFGVYLEFFESMYSLVVLVNTHAYTIQFTENNKNPEISANNMTYTHYRYAYNEPHSIMYGYELGVIWLFENYDLPF